MDSITQIVLGAAVGEAVAGRKIGGKAAFWGAIGGTIPDLDVFLRIFYDPFDAALVHRGFSHSLLFACLAGPILGWLFHRWSNQKHTFKMWTLLWFLSIVTHPILDMFTNYGTQFLWPFSPRITFNTVFVADPLYTIPFAFLLVGSLFMKRDSIRRSYWNWSGIIYSTTYLLWGVIVKLSIYSASDSYFKAAKVQVNRTMVTPMPLTSFYWAITGENDSAYYVTYKSLFKPFNPNEMEIIPKQHHLLTNLKWIKSPKEDQIRYITNDFYTVEQHHDTLIVYDLRFGTTNRYTAGKISEPMMGYGIVLKQNQATNYFFYRTKAFKEVDFADYLDKVFGE